MDGHARLRGAAGRGEGPADRPVRLAGDQLAQLPPTLVITDERDVLRSQGQQFARNLEAAGVPTTHRYYAGVMQEFFGAAAVLDEAEQAQQEAAAHFRQALGAPAAAPAAGR